MSMYFVMSRSWRKMTDLKLNSNRASGGRCCDHFPSPHLKLPTNFHQPSFSYREHELRPASRCRFRKDQIRSREEIQLSSLERACTQPPSPTTMIQHTQFDYQIITERLSLELNCRHVPYNLRSDFGSHSNTQYHIKRTSHISAMSILSFLYLPREEFI